MSTGKNIETDLSEENKLIEELKKRNDAEAKRMLRYLEMPDLSRTKGHPIQEIVERTLATKSLEGFDVIKVPEIVSTEITFDLFNFAKDHPARSRSDTYFVNDKYILRPHDTLFWHYYFKLPEIQEKIKNKETFGAMCYGKVYRKDEIDRKHMNIFHQIGGGLMAPMTEEEMKDKKASGLAWKEKLKDALNDISHNLFGKDVKNRFNDDDFPYTDPSLEMEIEKDGQWIEMLGCGVPREGVLSDMGVEGYTGWWFGFGLERLAIVSMELPDIRLLWSKDPRVSKQLKLGQKYKEVSKYPPVTRDISFIVNKDFVPNDYFDLIRDIGGDLVEEVELTDSYEDDKKFGADRKSFTYHILYRSIDRTLTSDEIDPIHKEIEKQTKEQFDGEVR